MAGDFLETENSTLDVKNLDLEKYRKMVRNFIDMHSYNSALFWADKIVSITNDAYDVYWLAQCMFLLRQYHRGAHLIRSRGLEKTNSLCHYIASLCLYEGKDYSEALSVLDLQLNNINDTSEMNQSTDTMVPGMNHNMKSALLLLKGRVYESLENRALAADCYKGALLADVHCYDAFLNLSQHQMMDSSTEKSLVDSLPLKEQCKSQSDLLFTRTLYQSMIKKYDAPSLTVLPDNLDMLVARAERLYYGCSYKKCFNITEQVLSRDPYHTACLPLHIACLVEMNKSNKLFKLAHELVDLYPDNAIAWYAVGCYYYLIGRSDPARRFLGKATSLDKLFLPAWLMYGHSFAVENEHDQAMAAYFNAFNLFKGCHLPALYVGLECGLTNNARLASKFFDLALSIAQEDPFVMHEMGVIAYQNHNYTVAENCFMDALTKVKQLGGEIIADKWEPLLNNLGHVNRKLKKYEEALEFHKQALVVAPMKASTFCCIGYIQALTGDLDSAVNYFHKTLALKRDDSFATTMLSYVIEQLIDESPPFPGAGDVYIKFNAKPKKVSWDMCSSSSTPPSRLRGIIQGTIVNPAQDVDIENNDSSDMMDLTTSPTASHESFEIELHDENTS
uniref:Cell division cycle protein 16 homolog n=1 Tax=Cacopsylla melanoneura TaxID=428564 RepID=A0A8D9ER57_9HEMI